MPKPHIPVSLVCVDTTPRVDLASRAIKHCTDLATFDSVKLLTNDMSQPHAIKIDRIDGVHGYSNFVARRLHEYVETSHCLIVQWDGYVLNPFAWQSRFLNFDYIGAAYGNWVGIGGFSLRSKRFLQIAAKHRPNENAHPEDNFFSLKYRAEFEKMGIRYATHEVAQGFTIESRTYNPRANVWSGTPIAWSGQFGFHSYLTPLYPVPNRPKIFHHSGDFGDIIYSLPTIAALGGGMLYVSPQVTPMRVRAAPTQLSTDSITSLLQHQECVWSTVFTELKPASTDYDLNQFRRYYSEHRYERGMSILTMIGRTFGVDVDGRCPWLWIPDPPIPQTKPIVVARSERYHNDFFPWRRLVDQHGADMLFVGTAKEYDVFSKMFGVIGYMPTKTLLDLANVIQQSRVFIGNQSAPLAIALGLGKNVIVEQWPGDPNTQLPRENAIYCEDGKVEIPKEWV